jgi:pyruvate/2-oxoglutarate dehydrogenase complex dihydrolipoamide dehydrogenase (E3) component
LCFLKNIILKKLNLNFEEFMSKKNYDIIIIGGGSAGLGALGMAQEFGWNPLMIDSDEANIGGDCLNFGCVPSKALIHIAKQFYGARKASAFGMQVEGKADMKKILDYVHAKQAVIRHHESADYIRAQGVDLEIGIASFVDENTVQVGDNQFTSERIIIATGSRPRHIPFKGIDQVEVFTNENLFYDMKTLPDRLLVVGGGPIGCEMAQTFSRFGSEVTILEMANRIVNKEREEYSHILQDQLRKEGIKILTETKLVEFVDSATAKIDSKEKGEMEVGFDAVLLSIGRVLNLEKLNLEKAGIETDDRGKMILDDCLRTTNKNVYASGDAAGMYQFSHGAELHTKLLKHNFKNNFGKSHNSEFLSWVTFTQPEIATFGHSEKYLQDNNIEYWRQDQDFSKDDRAVVDEYTYGKITLLLTPKTFWNKERKIIGGSIIAPNAGELMQELTLAMETGLSIDAIYDKLYAYPVASRINQQTVMGVIEYDKKNKT